MPTFAEVRDERRGIQQEDEDLTWRLRLAAQRLKVLQGLREQRERLQGQLQRQTKEHELRRETALGTQKRHEDVMAFRRDQADDYKNRSDRAHQLAQEGKTDSRNRWTATVARWTKQDAHLEDEEQRAAAREGRARSKAEFDALSAEWDRAYAQVKGLGAQKATLFRSRSMLLDPNDPKIQSELDALEKEIGPVKKAFAEIDRRLKAFVDQPTTQPAGAAQPPAEVPQVEGEEVPVGYGEEGAEAPEAAGQPTLEEAKEYIKRYGNRKAAEEAWKKDHAK